MRKISPCLFAVLLMLILGCNNFGKKIGTTHLEIYYKDGVTLDEANRVMDFLVKSGFQDTTNKDAPTVSIQLVKKGSVYIFKEVVRDGIDVGSDYYKQIFRQFAAELSKNVFNNAPVKINACNNLMQTKEVYEMNLDSSLKTYEKPGYSIKYPSSWVMVDTTGGAALFTLQPSVWGSINLTTEDLTVNPMGLDKYAVLAANQLNDSYPALKIIENSKNQGEHGQYQKFVYFHNHVRIEQYLIMENNTKAYILTLGLKRDKASPQLIKACETVMNTFTVL